MNRILKFTKYFFKILRIFIVFTLLTFSFAIFYLFLIAGIHFLVRKFGFHVSTFSYKQKLFFSAFSFCPNDINLNKADSQD